MPDVTLLGRIGYDLFAEEHGTPLKDVKRFSRYLGGSAANAAVGLARLGIRTAMISCLGDDAVSDYLLGYLDAEGVDTRRVSRLPGALASLCLTEVSPPDRFAQVFYRNQAADTLVQVGNDDRELIRSSRFFGTNGTSLCASPSRESTLRALQWAHEAGVKTCFDVDYRASSWRSPEDAALYAQLALPLIDVLIANPLELELIAGTGDLGTAVRKLWSPGKILVAKLGDRGTHAVDASGHSFFVPPYGVPVVSTIGAGDGFAAGFLSSLARGTDIAHAVLFGNAAAALVVAQMMCSEAMPRLREVNDLMAAQPEVRAQSLGSV